MYTFLPSWYIKKGVPVIGNYFIYKDSLVHTQQESLSFNNNVNSIVQKILGLNSYNSWLDKMNNRSCWSDFFFYYGLLLLPAWAILPIPNVKVFMIAINGYKVTTKLWKIICGSQKQMSCCTKATASTVRQICL